MLVRELAIELDKLREAAEMPLPGCVSYLDCETGEIRTLSEELLGEGPTEDDDLWADRLGEAPSEEDAVLARRIVSDVQGRYLRVPRDETWEAYRDMQLFIATVDDPHERELLVVALDGRGAFGRFKGVLSRYPAERQRRFAFRDERIADRLRGWLETEGIHLTAR